MHSFLLALQFLSIIPISYQYHTNDKQLGNSSLFYPVIGLLLGGLLAVSSFFIIHFTTQTQAAIILILWVVITGGLHLDGLADCADAWVGGLGSKLRSLEIMKDPASGPIAVSVLILILLLKWTLIVDIVAKHNISILIITPMLGRLAILILMVSSKYIRPSGLASSIIANLPLVKVKIMIPLGLIIGIYYLGFLSIIFMLIMLFLIHYQAKQRLGGVTGDVYGATVELVEVSILLGAI